MAETKTRSLVKTISWRTLATITTAILVFIFTGSLALAAGIGSLEVILKLLLYYFHERAWDRVSWGKNRV